MATPPEMPMPSAEDFLLPQRAYLLAFKNQALPARLAALADSRAHFESMIDGDSRLEAQLALLGVIGDAMQTLEDLGNLGSSMTEGLEGLAFYVKATVYDPSHVNNFYARLHKRDEDYFMRLCGFRLGEYSLFEVLGLSPTEGYKAAFAAAERATAKLVREHLSNLAKEWERYRRFFHAYKHAMLVANPDEVEILSDSEELLDGIVVWARRRKAARVGNHATGDLREIADHIQTISELAIELVDHLALRRVRVFEQISFNQDGSVSTLEGRLRYSPWQFWLRGRDIDEGSLKVLAEHGIKLDSIEVLDSIPSTGADL